MTTEPIYDHVYYDTRYRLNRLLHNPLEYYEALAAGKPQPGPFGSFAPKPTIEQRATLIAEQQAKFLSAPLDRYGKATLSDAVQQVRADLLLLKHRKDSQLKERAAIGRMEVLQSNLLGLLKQVKKLTPTQKTRKGHNLHGTHYDALFNTLTLHFVPTAYQRGFLVIEMRTMDEAGEMATVWLSEKVFGKLYTTGFAVKVDRDTFTEVIKASRDERISLEYHDWIGRFVIRQGRDVTRLVIPD